MFEMLINPKSDEKRPWKMFFIGLLYAFLSLVLVKIFFGDDFVLSQYSGMIVVTFCVMFSLPFMYYMIKEEEEEDEQIEGFFRVWKTHKDSMFAFLWLFFGFVVAFSFFFVLFGDSTLFNAQIGTYCMINSPGNFEGCVGEYSFEKVFTPTGAATEGVRFLSIIENNVFVMIFTLVFSLIFGAGAIFVLAWNASVIAAAIGMFTKYHLSEIPCGLIRYMIHGFPEIAAYFVTALAGGIFGAGVIRNGLRSPKNLKVFENVMILIFISIIFLAIAGLIEVYFTPNVMSFLSKIKICG
ncbi:MAG: stage II sporulation protein M [Nanoarchaeota archaeon]